MSHSTERTQLVRRGQRGQVSQDKRDEERMDDHAANSSCYVCGNDLNSSTSDDYCVDCQ